MRPYCEVIVQTILPTIRAMIARELIVKFNFTQKDAAERLGTTRAAVTQYLSLKRGGRMKQLETLPWVQSSVQDLAEKIVQEPLSEEINTSLLCYLCEKIRTNLSIDDLHDLMNSKQPFNKLKKSDV